jgi:hypothetical protein
MGASGSTQGQIGDDELEHQELKNQLGVPADQPIPAEKMQAAIQGVHGPDVQQKAARVKTKIHGPGMGQIFKPAQKLGHDNAGKPHPTQPTAPRKFKIGKE